MEERRRLPSWMVGASTTNKASKPLNVVADSAITSDDVNIVTKSSKPNKKDVTQNHKKEIHVSCDKNFLVKCETKRKKISVENNPIACRDPDREVNVEKRKRGRAKRKAEESNPSRKKNEKKYNFDSGIENQDLSCDDKDVVNDDDDDDLTMDDILSIAKEFVENDKNNTGQQKASEVQHAMKSKPAYNSLPVNEETDSHREPVETTSKVTLADVKMTGDPAQDMLDLFLGPLLNKPIVKETGLTDNIIIPREIKNQQHTAIVSNKPVTLTKKKSSLRDAVAMLLD